MNIFLKNSWKIVLIILVFNSDSIFAQREYWGIAQGVNINYRPYIFRLDSTGSNLQIVHIFDTTSNVDFPTSLTMGSNGKLYALEVDQCRFKIVKQ